MSELIATLLALHPDATVEVLPGYDDAVPYAERHRTDRYGVAWGDPPQFHATGRTPESAVRNALEAL